MADCSRRNTDDENAPPDEIQIIKGENVVDVEEFVVVRRKKKKRSLKLLTMNKIVKSPMKNSHIKFDEFGAPVKNIEESVRVGALISKTKQWKLTCWKQKSPPRKRIINNNIGRPPDLCAMPHISKYWAQRYQLFSKYDEGIKLDEESWYTFPSCIIL